MEGTEGGGTPCASGGRNGGKRCHDIEGRMRGILEERATNAWAAGKEKAKEIQVHATRNVWFLV